MRLIAYLPATTSLLLFSFDASAHSFGRVYNLPVPFWLYAWGAVAALVASFIVVGYFVTQTDDHTSRASKDISAHPFIEWGRRIRFIEIFGVVSVFGLTLTIVTGLWGTKSPYGNFNMTFFWVIFILVFTYVVAVFGNLYAAINPWKLITSGVGRLFKGYCEGRFSYPEKLGYWPAFALYLGFIWVELFGRTTPFSLAVFLSAYTALNFVGVGLIGSAAWFKYCEFLSVFLRLTALMAPVEHIPPEAPNTKGTVRLRMPFVGLIDQPAASMSLLLFVLFMLSSTAFDGLRETVIWQRLFWVDLYQVLLVDFFGSNPLAAFPAMRDLFYYWQSFWLLSSPFIYFLVYGFFIWLTRLVTRSQHSLSDLSLQFALPLLPIALVYNVTHYYTLIQTQGIKIVALASDPFGYGWDLFGTANWLQRTIIPDAGTVWHVQVGLIVLGHIVSVYLAHIVALRVFPTHRQAVISQIPMLLLMVFFTTIGLWILSQPIKAGA